MRVDKQEQRALVFMVTLLALLMLAFKPYLCRFRNGHQPDENAVSAFLNGDGETLQTKCVTCECELELRVDPEDQDLYWIIET